MLKYTDTEVVFKEIPDEITLAINISNCPIHCPGCHSKDLWEDIGDELNELAIEKLIIKNKGISCLAFMGGDNDPSEINKLAKFIRSKFSDLKIAWYSGRNFISKEINLNNFDFIKIGPYIEKFGGLDKETTNQIMYYINGNELIDITKKFIR